MEYIGPIRPSIYSIEFAVLPMDVPKFEALVISIVAEWEHQRICKRYIGGVIGVDIKERL